MVGRAAALLLLVGLGLLDHDLHAVLQDRADGLVGTGDDLLVLGYAALDFHERIVGDAGLNLAHLHLVGLADKHDALELLDVALGILALGGDREFVTGTLLGFLLAILLDLLGRLAAVSANRDALHRHGDDVLDR